MATSGDILLAIREDFYMATDTGTVRQANSFHLWASACRPVARELSPRTQRC
jgi:hypothetical protein